MRYENIEFIKKDVHNYVREQHKILGKHDDWNALLIHFLRISQLNKAFFLEIDIDKDSYIHNVF